MGCDSVGTPHLHLEADKTRTSQVSAYADFRDKGTELWGLAPSTQ